MLCHQNEWNNNNNNPNKTGSINIHVRCFGYEKLIKLCDDIRGINGVDSYTILNDIMKKGPMALENGFLIVTPASPIERTFWK